jgi:hypothetical protein
MKIIYLLIGFIVMSLNVVCGQSKNERWDIQRAQEWQKKTGWIAGCNFAPSNAINQLEMWQEDTFDPVTIDHELGMAEELGFNAMRVFLHHLVWKNDPDGFKKRIDEYLKISSRHKIATILVFFDDCWNPSPKIGKQPEPKLGIHNSGWMQDPGQEASSDTTVFPELEKYVKDILTHFATDERIILWDLYNEPGNSDKGDKSLPLLKKVFQWSREVTINQPVSVGYWKAELVKNNEFQLENSDIITYHNYGDSIEHKKLIDNLKTQNRPLVCTEYMARKAKSTFQTILPLLKDEKVGAINWGFVSGKTNTIYAWDDKTHTDGSEPELWFHDIYRKDGTPFDKKEVEFIKETIKGK